MAKEELETQKKEVEVKTGNVKVILKSNYDVVGKDGVETKKPDEEITLSAEVARELVSKAWAIYK